MCRSVLFLAAISIAAPGSAASLQFSHSNQITGVSDLVVGDAAYDVTLVDGTCTNVFDGCRSSSDFDLSPDDVSLAASKLVAELFSQNGPSRIFGCANRNTCAVHIPYAVVGDAVSTIAAAKTGPLAGAVMTGLPAYSINYDLSDSREDVYAKFTLRQSAVPEATTWIMMILGFVGIAAQVRGRRKFVPQIA